jgi:antibiotic biosynthesis monooxygenase (ABM) superfamily enzyme
MARVINMVATECQPEVEEKFNKWYNEVHIPLLFKFKGMKKVTRFKILNKTNELPTYICIYEFDNPSEFQSYSESQELADARAEMKESWKDGGWEIKWRASYEEMKTWER